MKEVVVVPLNLNPKGMEISLVEHYEATDISGNKVIMRKSRGMFTKQGLTNHIIELQNIVNDPNCCTS